MRELATGRIIGTVHTAEDFRPGDLCLRLQVGDIQFEPVAQQPEPACATVPAGPHDQEPVVAARREPARSKRR